jgi:ADP-heptose:LPS heptosyltransferase
MAECAAFLANDSGLAHLAGGLGVPAVVVFGMTSAVRGLPLGPSVAVTASTPCAPCHDEGSPDFRCPLNLDYRCVRQDIAAESAVDAVRLALRGTLPAASPIERGPFQLYGRAVNV